MAPTNLHSRLDAARGLSAIIVMIDHTFAIIVGRVSGRDLAWHGLSVAGTYAVVVFFLLSGHLITKSLISNIKRNDGRLDIREYAASRLSRIYPPLIGSIFLCVAIWGVLSLTGMAGITQPLGFPDDPVLVRSYYTLTLREVLSAITLQQGGLLQANGPLWSLYVECQMYMVAGVVFVIWKGSRFAAVCGALLVLIFCTALMDQLVMVAVWTIGSSTTLLKSKKLWSYASIAAATVVCLILLLSDNIEDITKRCMLPSTVIAASVILSYILFFARRDLFPSLFKPASRYSYSLYITHFPLSLFILSASQQWVSYSLPKAWIVFGAAMLTIPVAASVFAVVAEDQAFYKAWLLGKRSTSAEHDRGRANVPIETPSTPPEAAGQDTT